MNKQSKIWMLLTYLLSLLALLSIVGVVYGFCRHNTMVILVGMFYFALFILSETRFGLLTKLWHKSGKKTWQDDVK